MSIRYAVYRNPFSTDPADCTARVLHSGTIGFEELVRRVASRHTTVSLSDIVAVVEDLHSEITTLLQDGWNVNTPLVDYQLTIRGRFEGPEDTFDRSRHRLQVRFRAGSRLRDALRDVSLHSRLPPRPGPSPREFYDLNSGTHNEVITPGGIARLWGYRLKFDPTDPAQGIFFVAEDKRETRVTVVALNEPRQLFFHVPDLPAGRYRLEVRVVMRHSNDVRGEALDEWLTVA